MIFQLSMAGFEWIVGLGIMFGFALVMTVLTINKVSSFFAWLTIFCGFVVWGDLLPLWSLVICIIILTTTLYFDLKKGGNGV